MVEYEAEIKTAKRVLYIRQEAAGEEGREAPELRLEIKPDIDDWRIESTIAYLAEITETPLAYRLATESDIEVKVMERKRKK